MSPVNLGLRFVLELVALAGWGIFAYRSFAGIKGIVAVVVTVLVLAAIWGVFNVPDDPSRSGNAPVVVPGWLRLMIELIILFGGAYALYLTGYARIGVLVAALIVVHYLWGYERIAWLLSR